MDASAQPPFLLVSVPGVQKVAPDEQTATFRYHHCLEEWQAQSHRSSGAAKVVRQDMNDGVHFKA